MARTKTTSLQWTLLPKQRRFIESTTRHVLYSGGLGAGKTRTLCMKAVRRAIVPGAVEGMGRRLLSDFKRTTLRTLLEPDGDLPPVLPPGTYVHNKGEQRIIIRGGGTIQYFGFGERQDDERNKVGSMNLTGCGVDQAEELSEAQYRQVSGRCRVKVEGLVNQTYSVCNPGHPSHFLAQRFGMTDEYKPKPNHEGFTGATYENTFLPDDYREDIASWPATARARYYEGKWVASDGLVYESWNRHEFVQDREPFEVQRSVVGIDWGFAAPSVMLLLRKDDDGGVHVAEEYYKAKRRESEVIEEAKRWRDEYNPDVFVVDPSSPGLIESMRHAGLNVAAADNDKASGLHKVRKRLHVVSGRPLLPSRLTARTRSAKSKRMNWTSAPTCRRRATITRWMRCATGCRRLTARAAWSSACWVKVK